MRLSFILAVPLFVGCSSKSAKPHSSDPDPASGGRIASVQLEPAFACSCPEGSDFGVHLTLARGEVLIFDEPPRFHDPDASDNLTWEFECDDPETPIYFDGPCTAGDLLEACHAEQGCLQIKKTTFVWLGNDGAELASGPADFEWDLIGGGALATLDHLEGTLGPADSPTGTFVTEVCRLPRDDCLQ